MTQVHDIVIAGGGVAGLAAAAAFGSAGFDVVCIDPAPPVTDEADPAADLRTTAFLQPARDILDAAGLWDRLAPFATPLQIMRIVDLGGGTDTAPPSRAFDAADISDAPFGWNLPNWLLRREMLARLADLPNVDFRPGVGFSSALPRSEVIRVSLSDGAAVTGRLLIGADGRDSAVRQASGIDARTLRYGQKAVTFAVTHDAPHENVSTEVHRSGGPFTLVPLPDRDGRPCSAVVWMERGAEASRLANLETAAFEAEATDRSGGLFGPLTLASRRMIWPIISRVANAMTAPRTALMAEAAHVVPPIGAQGLNMSLADIACLLELARAARDDLGGPRMLDRYGRRRHPEILTRVAGVDMLNRASMADGALARGLRARGMGLLHDIAPVRRGLMRLGLGAKG